MAKLGPGFSFPFCLSAEVSNQVYFFLDTEWECYS